MAIDAVRLSAIIGIGTGAAGDDLRAGRRFGQYMLIERVGAGASAIVHRARHQATGAERALKVLRPGVAARAGARERFLRAARIAAAIRHPNVVAVHDSGNAEDGTAYAVMEYVRGWSLAERLRAGLPAIPETLRVAGQLAAALEHLHRLGVVHGDVKPSNVLIGDCGVTRLGDVGAARPGEDGGGPAAGPGMPDYTAPERRDGRAAGDARSDVYSLAVLVHEMLTGRTPCAGAAEDGQGRMPAPPRACDPGLPRAVDRVLARALATAPERRHRSAGRLVAELTVALGDAWAGALAAPGAAAPAPRLESRAQAWPAAPSSRFRAR